MILYKKLKLKEAINLYCNPGLSIDEISNAKIFWITTSLAHVLTALGDDYSYYGYIGKIYDGDKLYIRRKLLNEDGTDATLRDQGQETQDILFDIICKGN